PEVGGKFAPRPGRKHPKAAAQPRREARDPHDAEQAEPVGRRTRNWENLHTPPLRRSLRLTSRGRKPDHLELHQGTSKAPRTWPRSGAAGWFGGSRAVNAWFGGAPYSPGGQRGKSPLGAFTLVEAG